jgi:HTH-type transcriptional regulator / antitoxin HigA
MLKPIRTKKEYKAALERIYELMQLNLKPNSEEYDELEVLSILVSNYEESNFPISLPDPIEAIQFRLEQMNLSYSDLIPIIGSKSRTSEVMNRKRKLSLAMIRALHKELNIPASALIGEYL